MARICLIGGSGFIGRHIAEQLSRRQDQIIIPTRNREKAKRDLIMLPTVDLIPADIRDEHTLDALLAGCDVLINLVGILHSRSGRPYGPQFAEAHVALPRRLAAACVRNGVRRLIHLSALGASADAPSQYLRSKAAGEQALREAAGPLELTLFRPSVVFGPDDQFLNAFARLQRFLPFMLLAMPEARFQPVYVEDVARAVLASLAEDQSIGQTYELVGPRVYSLRELVSYAGRLCGHPRPIAGLGLGASMLLASVMECLPGRILSRDNVRSMRRDNVSAQPLPFGIEPTPLEAVAPGYIQARWASRYDRFREVAARR
jgi:uncharacterized protein YbjT (DUF2867 family)